MLTWIDVKYNSYKSLFFLDFLFPFFHCKGCPFFENLMLYELAASVNDHLDVLSKKTSLRGDTLLELQTSHAKHSESVDL
jgi:hypothetical protein